MSVTASSSTSQDTTPVWIQKLLKDCDYEVIEARKLKLVGEYGRRVVWNISAALGMKRCGIPGQACRLFERYLSNTFMHYMDNYSDPFVRQLHLNTVKRKLPLVIACCVQLAAKMNSMTAIINAKVIRVALLCKGLLHSVEEILRTESEIFVMIGHCIPIRTSVEIAEMLASEVNLPLPIILSTGIVMDITEYYREEIDKKVRAAFNVEHTTEIITVCSLHLAASAVAATSIYLEHDGPDPLIPLAILICSQPSYLICIRNAILTKITDEQPGTIFNLKRKL